MELGELIAKTWQKQQEDNSGVTSAIWRIFAELNKPKGYSIQDELNIDPGKHVLAMFSN